MVTSLVESVTSLVPATEDWHDQEVNVIATSLLKGSCKDDRAKLFLVIRGGAIRGKDHKLWDVGKNFIVGKMCSPRADHQRDWGNLHAWRGFNFLLDKPQQT